MKELNELLKHLNAYVYDKSSEKIMIDPSTADAEAVKCYKNSMVALGIPAVETEINSQFEHISGKLSVMF